MGEGGGGRGLIPSRPISRERRRRGRIITSVPVSGVTSRLIHWRETEESGRDGATGGVGPRRAIN